MPDVAAAEPAFFGGGPALRTERAARRRRSTWDGGRGGHPGQRGEQISAALGTDSTTMRPVMKRLIEERKVKTKGERRGMTYAAV